ncbi:MAG: putative hydro-lyase [bacterium]|nr:putative hydro-lyase [bacterium]
MAVSELAMSDLIALPTQQVRHCIRAGQWTRPTSGLAPGYTQANLAIVPRKLAYDFLLFCQRNPKPCPLLEVLDVGDPEPRGLAPGADIRTDIPRYRVYRHGELIDEAPDIMSYWQDDLVSFLLGCSFTFEHPMMDASIGIRHLELGVNVPMFITNQQCKSAGVFQGPMVVSMRPISHAQVTRTIQITSRFPAVHGAPVHIGDPTVLGIGDLQQPDFGDAVPIATDETPVFWACGVTPQAVIMQVKPALAITHAPGYMFITDQRDSELAVL